MLDVVIAEKGLKQQNGPASRWGNRAVLEMEKPRGALRRARYGVLRVSKCKERAGNDLMS
jgi:hypothetical protein